MSRLPIRLRVSAAFALAMAVVLAVSGLFLYLRLSSHLSLALDRQLQVRAQDLAALTDQPAARLSSDEGNRFIESGESYAQLLAPSGDVLDATAPLGHTPLLKASELQAASRRPIYLDRPPVPGLDEPSRILATTVQRNGRSLVLVVGTTLQNRAETLASFRDELLIAGPLALILATVAGYLLAGLSLRQVESMRLQASAISADRPGQRLPVPPTGDELERLGRTLNEMLDRLELALQRERDFVADAGHELRTPLALLRTELEVALRQANSFEDLRGAMRRSSQDVDRLSQLAEDLLLIARSDRGRLQLHIESLDVPDLLGSVLSRTELRAEAAGTTVVASAAGVTHVDADRLRLEQALGNLVDNALRYGGDEVRLEASRHDGEIRLHVRDNGPGFPEDFLERAFERFTRADAARGAGGAGLGLAIVGAIAEAHGGNARAVNTIPTGADVWVSLPDPRADEADRRPIE